MYNYIHLVYKTKKNNKELIKDTEKSYKGKKLENPNILFFVTIFG